MAGLKNNSDNNFTDHQTLLDLQIFGSNKTVSVSGLFDSCVTCGGRNKLENIFRNHNLGHKEISDRLECISFLSKNDLALDIDKGLYDFIETYLSIDSQPVRPTRVNSFHIWINELLKPTNQYYIIRRGILFLFQMISNLYEFSKIHENSQISLLKQYSGKILEFIDSYGLIAGIADKNRRNSEKLSVSTVTVYDNLLRYEKKPFIRELLDMVYTLDAYKSISGSLNRRGFCIPEIAARKTPFISIRGLFHPFIADPVKNDIRFCHESNTSIITGANMSGKSTFMKAFGIAVYLAHIGLPVPASRMEFSIFDGLFTTINLSDDMEVGYSHFYAEVKRIKTVAEHLNKGKKLVVIFDELFRGTNVKDAGDGTFLIIGGLLDRNDSVFMISTHITEVACKFENEKRILFRSFKTTKNRNHFVSDYKLHPGISNDRFGTEIIRNENILNLLKGSDDTKM